jgi:hypothetical protein
MKRIIQILFLFVGIFLSQAVLSKQSTWVTDSLSYYEKAFWSQLEKKDVEKAKTTLYHIQETGGQDLDPKVFDFFNRTILQTITKCDSIR